MSTWTPYHGDAYLDVPTLDAWCHQLAQACAPWVTLEQAGTSRQGRPIWLLTMGRGGDDGPVLWLDAGTHASEWTGVSAVCYALSRWAQGLLDGDEALRAFFERASVVAMPCISPDGVQAIVEGQPIMRSTMRPPPEGGVRTGFEAFDIDGDGAVRLMRWRHPSGSFVEDDDNPLHMRWRRVDDDPEQAWIVCDEGHFLAWDGTTWSAAPLRHGLDLNRNFPSHWAPFSMFGMDAGLYPTSEPESRAVVEAFAARPTIAAALTMHTYTGCVLTQPYRKDSPLSKGDIHLMEALARDMARSTGYDVYRTYPDFMYDLDKPIIGVWADTIATTFGLPGYTIELWNPYAHAGLTVEQPAKLFTDPDPAIFEGLYRTFSAPRYNPEPWRAFEHPQLGPVEIGGLDYIRTIRNPPPSLLPAECATAFTIVERARAALPHVEVRLEPTRLADDLTQLEMTLGNLGFLPTDGLSRGSTIGAAPPFSVRLELGDGLELIEGRDAQEIDHLDGWGNARVGAAQSSIYPRLPARGSRSRLSWILRGQGTLDLRWCLGRAGRGQRRMQIG